MWDLSLAMPGDSGQRPEHSIAANTQDRQSEAAQPTQRWVADFTHVWRTKGQQYAAVVLNLCSRRSVRCSISSSVTAQLVIDALMRCGWRGEDRESSHS